MAAAVAAESSNHQVEGYRSPEEQLARQTGMSPTQARRTLGNGRRLLEQPRVAEAALAGDLSPEQVTAVTTGADANPAKADELLQLARTSSLGELNEAVAKVRADSEDLESRRRSIHARRTLSRFTDLEGVYRLYLSGNPEDGMIIDRVLTEVRRRLTVCRRDRHIPNEKWGTLEYDAVMSLFRVAGGLDSEVTLAELVELGLFPEARTAPASGPQSVCASSGPDRASVGAAPDLFSSVAEDAAATADGGTPPEPDGSPSSPPSNRKRRRAAKLAGRPARVIVRIDLDTLLRGYPIDGEICDSPGYGPIPVSLVHDLMNSGQGALALVLLKAKAVQGVYLHRRHPNQYQKAALDFLYPVCAVRGCNTRAGMEADHREDWEKTHYTVLDLLDYLCSHHHRLKSNQGWALVDGRGKRDFVPPGDPRHPRNQTRPPVRDQDGRATSSPSGTDPGAGSESSSATLSRITPSQRASTPAPGRDLASRHR